MTAYDYRRVRIYPCPVPLQGGSNEDINLDVSRPIVYPNPALNEINLVFESVESKFADVFIYDQLGSEVYSLHDQGILEGNNSLKINVSSLPGGLYTLSLLTNAGREYKSVSFMISQ